MNIVVVNGELGIEVYKSWKEVKKYTSFKKEDFAEVGKNDFILECDQQTYEISKDIRLLERVASEKVFAKHGLDITSVAIWLTVIFSFMAYMKL